MSVDKIEISNNNIMLSIYPKTNEKEIDGIKYHIKQEVIEELFRIIRTWDKEYIDNTYSDGNRYEIIIYEGNKREVYRGVRKGPKNYKEFSELIRGIYDRR